MLVRSRPDPRVACHRVGGYDGRQNVMLMSRQLESLAHADWGGAGVYGRRESIIVKRQSNTRFERGVRTVGSY